MVPRRLAPLLACAAALSGCGLPLPLLHGPVPLGAGTASAGFGAAPLVPSGRAEEDAVDQLLLSLFASHRLGVDARRELGASFGLHNGFALDGKYLLVPGPLAVSGSLALSTGGVPLGVHPALLVGSERLYGGARVMTFPGSYRRAYPGLYAGASVGGGAIRLVPEVAWLRHPEEGRAVLTVGAQVERRATTGVEPAGFVGGWLSAMWTLFELLRDLFSS
jgi:hypothetical protein